MDEVGLVVELAVALEKGDIDSAKERLDRICEVPRMWSWKELVARGRYSVHAK